MVNKSNFQSETPSVVVHVKCGSTVIVGGGGVEILADLHVPPPRKTKNGFRPVMCLYEHLVNTEQLDGIYSYSALRIFFCYRSVIGQYYTMLGYLVPFRHVFTLSLLNTNL
jgi:hypothetical protein